MPRWSPAPPIPNDPTDPLYQQYLAIPSPGTGLTLTPIQLCILFRRSAAERHTRASEIFGPAYVRNTSGGLIRARFRNSDIITGITDQHLQAVGMTRAQIPRFASGGTGPRPSRSSRPRLGQGGRRSRRSRATLRPAAIAPPVLAPATAPAPAPVVQVAAAIVPTVAATVPDDDIPDPDPIDTASKSGPFIVSWEPDLNGPNFKSYIANLDISNMVHFGTRDSIKVGSMEMPPIENLMSWTGFVEQVRDAVLSMPGFRELPDGECKVRLERVEFRYHADEGFEMEMGVTVVPMVRDRVVRREVMDLVKGVMENLPRGYFMVAVGLEFR